MHDLKSMAEKYVRSQNSIIGGVANPLSVVEVEQGLSLVLEIMPLVEAKVVGVRSGSSAEICLSSKVGTSYLIWRSSDAKRNRSEVCKAIYSILFTNSLQNARLSILGPIWDPILNEAIANLSKKCKAAFASIPKEDFDAKKAKNAVEAKANRISAFKHQMKEAVKALLNESFSLDEIRDAVDEIYVESIHEQ